MTGVVESAFRVGGVTGNLPARQAGDGGSSPTPTLQFSPKDLLVRPIPHSIAAQVVRDRHYLRSAPASPILSYGIFAKGRLEGVAIFTPGPINGYRLLKDARREDLLCLARLWLSDDLPRMGESRVLSVLARLVARQTSAKALLSYADPAAGHEGTIYRAAGWLYLGEATAQPLMRIGSGPPRHLRTVGSLLGTHSGAYLRSRGIAVDMIPTVPKLRYLKLLDGSLPDRLTVKPRPYPTKGEPPTCR